MTAPGCLASVPKPNRPCSADGVQATQQAAKWLNSLGKMVEAAGIEKASTPMKSGTYSRNKCLKSASWTFASCRNSWHVCPCCAKQERLASVSPSLLLPASTASTDRIQYGASGRSEDLTAVHEQSPAYGGPGPLGSALGARVR